MNRIWMLAAAPLLLMAVMSFITAAVRSPGEMLSTTWMVLLVNALSTGLYMLATVFAGWRRGMCKLKDAYILVTLVLASLDVLIPTMFVMLLWLLSRSLKGGNLIMP